ncbi:MAG: metallopeptidase TldD-related protein [Candidatus Obscuribacterales bacterium]
MKTLISSLLALSAAVAPVATQNEIIFPAMKDEMARSIARLKLEGHQAPYYIGYTVHDTDQLGLGATFGALSDDTREHSRTLTVDVRIGDYKLDSASGSSEIGDLFGAGHSAGASSISVDNDYDALRRELWLRTDSAYKQAIEGLESKKTYLKQNTVEDRPDSFSRETPVTVVQPVETLELDKDKWSRILRDLTASFKGRPLIRSSQASLAAMADNHWFMNSEGFKNRIGEKAYVIIISAQAQATDGMNFSDQEMFPAYSEKELPKPDELKKRAAELCDRLEKLAAAPKVDDYRGPVLFEGQAGAQLFHQILEPKLARSASDMRRMLGTDMSEKLGQRILPKFIDVVDEPGLKSYDGKPLFGYYEVDDEGLKGQKVTLVEKGILKTICMSRIPTRTIAHSNGHGKRGGSATSNIFINSEHKLSPEALKSRLLELGKEEGLKEVYIVRRITGSASDLDFSNLQAFFKAFMSGSSGVSLYPPVLLYKVSVADGSEQLVRGGNFSNISMRILRDIDATGNDVKPYAVQNSREITSIVCPSVLISEVEIQKPDKTSTKRPILKNPNFDK